MFLILSVLGYWLNLSKVERIFEFGQVVGEKCEKRRKETEDGRQKLSAERVRGRENGKNGKMRGEIGKNPEKSIT
jgi:hypothetical protein